MKIVDVPTGAMLAPQEFCTNVLLEKYAAPGETTPQEVQSRVATALGKDDAQAAKFLTALHEGFVPGGRINSSAGTNRATTMVNCFVQPIADSMTGTVDGFPGIMTALGEASETMRRGGGVGYDFSLIRPMNARVNGTDSRASGPLSYMQVFNKMCATVESAGARRGAQMAVLRVDHPDIELFIDAKVPKTPESFGLEGKHLTEFQRFLADVPGFAGNLRYATAELANFNMSVGVTDAFMEAVIHDKAFDLVHTAEPFAAGARTITQGGVVQYVYKTIRARDLWERIMRNTYNGAEPGILFLDAINRNNNLRYCEVIAATNPCGEQVLPPYGCCVLGHLNLAICVDRPFTKNPSFNWERFNRVVAAGVELLDRVLDVTKWPLPQQQNEAMNKRRIGTGYFALADAMTMLGIRYDSEEGAAFSAKVTEAQRDQAYIASVNLAKELGPFPFFDADKYLEEGTFASRLPEWIKAEIRAHGIRNSHLLSLAPTGTGALAFGDNASSGVEPIFSLRQQRNKVMPDNSIEKFALENQSYRLFKAIHGEAAESEVFVTAQTMGVKDHLRVLAAVAPFIDSAISKTVNVPTDYPFDDFAQVYIDAWKLGLKGITTYRPNSGISAVLISADSSAAEEKEAAPNVMVQDDPERRVTLKDVQNVTSNLRWSSRPDVNPEGKTYPIKHPHGRFAVVVNHWVNGRTHPLEVYIAGVEQPRGLAAIAKSLSIDMRTDDSAWLQMKLDSLLTAQGDDGFVMKDPGTGADIAMPSLAAGFAYIVKHRLTELGVFENMGPSPMIDTLFSKREPKTDALGSVGWHCDVANPVTGDDFLLHAKELVLPGGQIRPYSIWLSGNYPRVLDGLMKVLSIDMRVSDPEWVAMKLRKLLNFGELRGDFLARVPGEMKQANYPSTVAYVAELLLARMKSLKLIGRGEPEKSEAKPAIVLTGRQCPQCHTLSLHKESGCDICSHCGHTGSCG